MAIAIARTRARSYARSSEAPKVVRLPVLGLRDGGYESTLGEDGEKRRVPRRRHRGTPVIVASLDVARPSGDFGNQGPPHSHRSRNS